MLTGHIDLLTSSGFIEGWALNTKAPSTACLTGVLVPGHEMIARGFSHRFRTDLAKLQIGNGSCAFRLKLSCPVDSIRDATLILVDLTSRQEICRSTSVPYSQDTDLLASTIDQLISDDPTMIHSIQELAGCEPMFQAFILAHGVDEFIRTAYIYTLGRAADPTGLTRYSRFIRQAELAAFELIKILANSNEFRSRPRLLSAPSAPGFPFKRR